ncbi:MAG: NUDIX hydrolase [Planctomycetota bacterium]
MHRRPLLELLDRYTERYPDEQAMAARVRALVSAHRDCFARSCLPGHITASAWIVSSDRREFLLGHHRKLGRWLQLGGHADGEHLVEQVALREAREESGMHTFELFIGGGALVPLDVDVHLIPPHGGEPEHFHHDLRFLLIAAPGQAIQVSAESLALRWFEMNALEQVAREPSLLRMGRKARAMLSLPGPDARPATGR